MEGKLEFASLCEKESIFNKRAKKTKKNQRINKMKTNDPFKKWALALHREF